MKKKKPKTAGQKRHANRKAMTKRLEKERANWVKNRLDWVNIGDSNESHNDELDGKLGDDAFEHRCDHESHNHNAQSCKKLVESEVDHDFSIISWNVLADAYCSRSSHKNLPTKFQNRVFNRKQRQDQIRQILRLFVKELSTDLIALQEVDPPLEVAACMKSLGYGVVETDASSDGRVGRVDSCGLYFHEDKWKCLDHETIRLDDLAIRRTMPATDGGEGTTHNVTRNISKCTEIGSRRIIKDILDPSRRNLKGLEQSFVRKNVTLLAKMEHKPSKRKVVIVVSHLFWNPAYDYVKLCQAHCVAQCATAFSSKNNDIPIIWCGDFNSQPKGFVHQYLTKGVANAKATAPWYFRSNERWEETKQNEIFTTDQGHLELTDQFERLHLTKETIDNRNELNSTSTLKVKYLLDSTLNKFCRWLRILGVDAALETKKEEEERTRDGKLTIFKRCKDEGRSLVTTASKLLNRKDCPPGTYLLDTKSLLNPESAIVQMLICHGVKLEPKKMLTRCVVCNGSIEPVFDEDQRRDIFRSYEAPVEVREDILDVYQCNTCSQGYWWCEKPTSSASRVKCQANKLLELCIRGGVPIAGDLGLFAHFDVDKMRTLRSSASERKCLHDEQLDVVKWLQEEELKNPLPNMASVYASKRTQKESLTFTNVTHDFVGSLDYILYQIQAMKVVNLLYVPKTFDELNDLNITNGHLLPSCDWPSDHLAIGCRISFRTMNEKIKKSEGCTFKNSKSCHTSFPPGPPFPFPWCGFIVESESDSVSATAVEEESVFPLNEDMSKDFKSALPLHEELSSESSEPVLICKNLTNIVSGQVKTDHTSHGENCIMHSKATLTTSHERSCEAHETKEREAALSHREHFNSPSKPTPTEVSGNSSQPDRKCCTSSQNGHRCACFFPNVPTLFEMAERRRQYRLGLKNGSA